MTRFAFIIHPLTPKDAARKYPMLGLLPNSAVEYLLQRKRPSVVSHITGIESPTGAKTEGWFIGCPLTPKQMVRLPLEFVYGRISEAIEVAHGEGAELVGLGAFTSVVGDGGLTLAKRSPIPITTGNSYTVATAIEGALEACRLIGVDTNQAVLAVVGATGSIGKTCAQLMAPKFGRTLLVGRDLAKTEAVARSLQGSSRATTDVECLRDADCVISVTSSDSAVIEPHHLKPGSVVCDVARPRDVSVRVGRERKDVLVIEGGVVRVPGIPQFNFDFGFPPATAYACMSETMMLALDGRAESFTLGKDVSVAQVEETAKLARKHGFELAGFRSFEREVGPENIERARAARLQHAAV